MMVRRRLPWYVVIVGTLALFGACATPKVSFEVPDGFARYVEDGRQSAISPEGLLLTAYREDNEPPQTAEFWSEALERHLSNAGYRLLDDGVFSTTECDGRYFEWVAPLGEEEWVYLSAFCVDGAKIAVVEAAGPYEIYRRYRGEIRTGLETIAVR